jgi:tRNA threonylcarbamoyladenosine biosynthesis protein TsaE
MNETYTARSVEETIAFASRFAENLQRGDVVALYGELGSGKTQFVKGVCRTFGTTAHVTSPSFVILNRYYGIDKEKREILLFHLDLYRIKSCNEVYDLGYEEFLQDNNICLIEWAEMLDMLLPMRRYDIKLALGEKENERIIDITKIGE